MGNWKKAFKNGLVVTFTLAGVLMSFISTAEACESYHKARLFCGTGETPQFIPASVENEYSRLLKLRARYDDAALAMKAASNFKKDNPRSVYNSCKTTMAFKIQASKFLRAKARACQQRADVCAQQCGAKNKASCQLLKRESEWAMEIAETYYDLQEIELLKECMAKHDVDEEILTASVQGSPNTEGAGSSLPKKIPVPTPAQR